MNWSGKCEGPGGGDRRGALCTGFTLVKKNQTIANIFNIGSKHIGSNGVNFSDFFVPQPMFEEIEFYFAK